MSLDDDRIMMRIAEARSVNKIEDPSLREFLEEPLARLYPDQYHRLLEIELMASISHCRSRNRPDFALSRWLESQRRLDALLETCGSQEELLAAVSAKDELRTDLGIWCLLDRSTPHASMEDPIFDFLEAAERAVLTRLRAEANPEGCRRRDSTTDLYGICLAMLGNRLRVRGDVTGGFELTRKATNMIRPGDNSYLVGRILLYFVLAATAAGHLDLATSGAKRALVIFRELGHLASIGESLNRLTHINILSGDSSTDMLANFLNKYRNSHRLPRKVAIQIRINLAGVILYFHNSEDAEPLLADLEAASLSRIERLWTQYFRAMWHLRQHRPAVAAGQFRYLVFEFETLGQPIQTSFAMLFEVLSLLDSGENALAQKRAAVAAEVLSLSNFYGGVATRLAGQLLLASQCKSLDRSLIVQILDIMMSPANQRGGA